MSNERNEKEKRNVHRSPQFPIVDLKDAVSKIGVIFKNDKRVFTSAEAILSHLGYENAKRAGYHGRIIAALKHFGLLDEEANKLKVSENAFKILHLEEDSEERKILLREMALLPNSFRKLWAYLDDEEIPSDKALESHLIVTEKFNPDSVAKFIKVFRDTISFAGLDSESEIPKETEISRAKNELSEANGKENLNNSSNKSNSEYETKNDETMMRFPISRNSDARVIFTGEVTQEAIEKLRLLLDTIKDVYPMQKEIDDKMDG